MLDYSIVCYTILNHSNLLYYMIVLYFISDLIISQPGGAPRVPAFQESYEAAAARAHHSDGELLQEAL